MLKKMWDWNEQKKDEWRKKWNLDEKPDYAGEWAKAKADVQAKQDEKAQEKAIRERRTQEQIKAVDGFHLVKKRVIQEEQQGLQVMWWLSRITAGLIAVAGLLMALVGMLTIIGIPLSLLMLNGCKGLADYAGGKRSAYCPNCRKRNYIHVEQTKMNCRKCKENITIIWE